MANDFYDQGDYDVRAWIGNGVTEKNEQGRILQIASARFEARPSICYDAKGRLWIAYEEGPEKWGHDYGALAEGGEPLYSSRSVRVVCLEDGKLMKPVAELPTSTVKAPVSGSAENTQQFEKATRYAYPRLGLDGKGRLWLSYRQSFGSRYSTHPGSYWLSFARRLDGDKWSEPIEVHHADGLLDSRPVMLPHAAGGLLIVHNTDGRYTTPNDLQNRIYTSYLDLPGEPVEPKLVPHDPGKKNVKAYEKEAKDIERIRKYRIESGGKKYQLLRGEFHRHTELSWDGGADGSLEDMFRYAIDAAALDWIGNGDHDNGAGREYPWWLVQKYTDAYTIKDRFTPLFCYERSVSYPHGHRNCLFVQRGVRTLPRLAEPDPKKRIAGIHADDTKMLYRYLKEFDGICAVHTSATGMGTDWRDNDPKVEPLVEIYQGDRNSYEMEEAPRAGYDPKSGKKPANIAGWFPKGYVSNALAKGYRLGFESSSDHWSTHISYCVALAEKHDRAGILAALKQRHSYAATDNIIVDVRSGDHIMGDEFKTNKVPVLNVHVIGTGSIMGIDLLKDGEIVEVLRPENPGGSECNVEWEDPKPEAGVHYYYLRVRQGDGQLAWSSPMWIEFAK
ncbi:MAG: CehA/McbA family metallohydrolase domain-containing protein [Vulcanimicrobiaceae bacterium]